MDIAKRIKERREELQLSRSDFAKALQLSVGAISNYENGFSVPKTEILCNMFSILQCDANFFYQDYLPSNLSYISMEEESLLKEFRTLSKDSKAFIKTVLAHEASKYHEEYAKEFIMLPPTKLIDHFPALASAGSGQFVFDDIPVSKTEVDMNCEADFAIDVNGNSMEPTYFDGDMLLIKKQDEVLPGEIGIFLLDGESYVKEYQKEYLHSHNKKYPDLLLKDYQDIRCIGKVIGKA